MNAPEPLNILRGVPVPRKRHFWTTAELATLRAVYPAQGAEAAARALPGRSLGQAPEGGVLSAPGQQRRGRV